MNRAAFLLSTMLLIALISFLVLPVAAQGPEPEPQPGIEPTPTKQWEWSPAEDDGDLATATPAPHAGLPVSAEASDGRALAGELHVVNPGGPTVLLLHQLYTDRSSWGVVLGTLVSAGINVLNVDVRGHGATGGSLDWRQAVDDAVVWLDWLRNSGWVRADAIATMGSSMGSSLALLSCAEDPQCRTAIAISPGWSYYGLDVEPAFAEQFGARPALIVYAEWDGWPSQGVPRMLDVATNPVTVQLYSGNQHGMDLFPWHEDLAPLVVEWLHTHAG